MEINKRGAVIKIEIKFIKEKIVKIIKIITAIIPITIQCIFMIDTPLLLDLGDVFLLSK